MRSRESKIEEEWLGRFRLPLDVVDRLRRRRGNVLIGIPVTRHRSGAAFPIPLFDRLPLCRVHPRVRRLHHLVVLDPAIGRKINHRVTEIVVEPMIERTVGD